MERGRSGFQVRQLDGHAKKSKGKSSVVQTEEIERWHRVLDGNGPL